MTRGDQRERDRAKARAKLEDKQKQVKAGSKLSRNLNDALALEAKVQSKKAMKEQQSSEHQGGSSVKPKPKQVANPSLDALLDAGLTSSKSKAAGGK